MTDEKHRMYKKIGMKIPIQWADRTLGDWDGDGDKVAWRRQERPTERERFI